MSKIDDSEIAESQLHSPHYLKSVTELGDDQPLTTSRDIYSSKGIKLLNAGVRVNSALYERLLHHKLIPNLDECLVTEDTFDNRMLVDEASQLMVFDKHLQMMRTNMPNDGVWTGIMSKIPLNPPIAFKLTVMHAKSPELLKRSIYVALVSIYIGMQAGLHERRLVQLATAALLHDIGMLHIDPILLERGHRMTDMELRHLYAHPLTAWMVVKEYREYSVEVLDAILQHHERIDGSGYPQGLQGDHIGQLGKIIAVAEIVASRYDKDDIQYGWLRLETILKLNSRRYGRDFVGYLKVFCQDETEIPPPTEEEKQLIRQHLNAISAVLAGWESMRGACSHERVSDFINERMQRLKIEVLDAGIIPYNVDENMLAMEDDPRACAEVRILLDEIIWQIHGILHEIRRRWPDSHCNGPTTGLQSVCDWISDVEMLFKPS